LVSTYGFPCAVVALGIFIKLSLGFKFGEDQFYSAMDLIWASLGIAFARLTTLAQAFAKTLSGQAPQPPLNQAAQLQLSQVDLFDVISYIFVWLLFFILIFALHHNYQKSNEELTKVMNANYNGLTDAEKTWAQERARYRRRLMLLLFANAAGSRRLSRSSRRASRPPLPSHFTQSPGGALTRHR
jgi:hypothetical protein